MTQRPELSARAYESAYMHWARTQREAEINLAVSGVPSVTRAELGVGAEDFELTGTSDYGWPPLMEALSAHLGVAEDRICHAEGTSMANHLAMAACLRAGDEVVIEEPAYGLLEDAASYLGATIRRLPRRRENAFQFDPVEVTTAIRPGTRLVIVTNLHNPSSARLADADLARLAQRAAEVRALLLVDEVYLDATFDAGVRTAHHLGDHVLTTSSLTKVYGLSGLRCGWVVGAPALIERMWRLQDLFGISMPHPAERLSLFALKKLAFLRERSRTLLERNAQRWNEFMSAHPGRLDTPLLTRGTVVFPRLIEGDAQALCGRLRSQYRTAVAPGHFFGMPDSFRIGLGVREPDFVEGLRRLGDALREGA